MTKLLIATRNQAKLKSFSELLKSFQLELLTLTDAGIKNLVEENGATFRANAELKAKTYCQQSGLPTLADDGGLEIDTLNGWPGVYSRRIFGLDKPEATDEEMITETLRKLRGVPWEKRTAKMRAVVALAITPSEIHVADVAINGYISEQPSSARDLGFPFRSIFYLPEAGKIVTDLEPQAQHDFMNHRKQAIIQLEPYLKALAEHA